MAYPLLRTDRCSARKPRSGPCYTATPWRACGDRVVPALSTQGAVRCQGCTVTSSLTADACTRSTMHQNAKRLRATTQGVQVC